MYRTCIALTLAGALASTAAAIAAVPPPVEAANGMVVSAQRLASEVGIEVLKGGGNAVDAAVAIGYALAVTHPCCGNLGGGGFMVIHLADGRETFLNFREKAPLAATKDMYLDAKGEVVPGRSIRGYLAVGVPGSVLGFDTALAKYGTLSRAAAMAPAIRLARGGFVLTEGDAAILGTGTKVFAEEPNVAAIFLKEGKPYQAGDRLVQKELAETLEHVAAEGPDYFYRGPIAAAVAAASAAHGGILTEADFARYTVTESPPLACAYRGYEVRSAPPPSSGGATLCEILGILEGEDLAKLGHHSAAATHLMIEAMRHAFLDRNSYLGDPAFVANPLQKLLSPEHAAAIRAAILADRATPSSSVVAGEAPHEGTNTTHYSVVDKAGNAVAVTYTINSYFGAKVIAGSTGFFLNNEMDDFTSKPGVANLFGLVQGATNAIQPEKRPLSSMTPTILLKDGQVFLVTGSPGGSRIITITLETVLDVVDYGMNVAEAVDAPRIHHQWLPDTVYAEPYALSPDAARLLTGMGYSITRQVPWGSAAAILIGPRDAASGAPTLAKGGDDSALAGKPKPGMRYGASDPRQPAGAAIGY